MSAITVFSYIIFLLNQFVMFQLFRLYLIFAILLFFVLLI